jgi:hypothetical protein
VKSREHFNGFPILPTEKFGPPAGLKLAHHYPDGETDLIM